MGSMHEMASGVELAGALQAASSGLARSLQTTCSTFTASSYSLFNDPLTGVYVEDPSTSVFGRPVFYNDNSEGIIYWTEVFYGRRRLEEADGQGGVATLPGEGAVGPRRDERTTRALRHAGQGEGDVADGGLDPPDFPAWAHGPILMAPGGGAPDALDAQEVAYSRGSPPDLTPPYGGDNGQLAACGNGAWIVAPSDGSFPLYAVMDCALHPTDVTASDWYIVECATCYMEDTYIRFFFECGSTTASSEIDFTPSPVPTRSPGATNSPAAKLVNYVSTLAPANVVVIDGNSTCDYVIVQESDDDGDYFPTGRAVDGRTIWAHKDGAYMEWYAGTDSRRLLDLDDAPREELPGPGTRALPRGPLGWLRRLWSGEDGSGGAEAPAGDLLAGNDRLAAVLRGFDKTDVASKAASAVDEFTASAAALGQARPAQESLAFCWDGYWILWGALGSMMAAFDCATHPADISTLWFDVGAYNDLTVRSPLVTISCPPGWTSTSSSPSAPGLFAGGIDLTSSSSEEGAGDSSSIADELLEDDGNGRGNLHVHVIVGIVAGSLACVLLCVGACLGYRAVHRSPKVVGQTGPMPVAPLANEASNAAPANGATAPAAAAGKDAGVAGANNGVDAAEAGKAGGAAGASADDSGWEIVAGPSAPPAEETKDS